MGCGLREKEKEKVGRGEMGRKREGERGVRFCGFLFKFFSFFQTFKLHSNKKPCIRIMMHKHLLFLTLSK
jgi:hypothetical protein